MSADDPIFRPTADTQSSSDTIDRKMRRGEGGETHQGPDGERLTTAQGIPVSDILVGVSERDAGMHSLSGAEDAGKFAQDCHDLRYWVRVA